MDSAEYFLRLFDYDKWANEQVLISIQDNLEFEGSDQAVTYFTHIAGSQKMWFHRISNTSEKNIEIWPDYGLPEALQTLNTFHEEWKQLVRTNVGDLDRIISYTNSKDTPYETPLSDILHHIVIHGQHHRAQVAKLLRNAKIDPPATDFIFFSRSN